MIKLTVFGSESTEIMKKQKNQNDESHQKESTPLLVNKSKTLQHSIYTGTIHILRQRKAGLVALENGQFC